MFEKSRRTFTGCDLASVIEDNCVEADDTDDGTDVADDMDAASTERLREENEQLSDRWKCKICFNYYFTLLP